MFQNNMGGTLDSICDEIRRQFSSNISDPIVEYCVAVKLESGSVMTLGSPKLGLDVFSEKHDDIRRRSRDWVPDHPFPLQKSPLSNYVTESNRVRSEANKVLRFFLGKNKYGSGSFLLWKQRFCLSRMKHSRLSFDKVIKIKQD